MRDVMEVGRTPLAPRSTQEERQIHATFILSVVKTDALWKKFGV